MQILSTVAELRQAVNEWRSAGERIALVPTMGNLHEGHLRLVQEAREKAGRVVVSIFVNPLQFVDADGKLGDFEQYPRTLEADQQKLASVDVVFTPAVKEVYPGGFQNETRVEVPGISNILCGAHRPGHFVGVATVVAKLFNMVQPDVAFFGEKDFQQLLVIKRMTTELCFPIEIVGVSTVREEDGLAMSSRNQYLSTDEHQQAATIYQTLLWVKDQLQAGEADFEVIQNKACQKLEVAGCRPDYVAIRRADNLQSATTKDLGLIILVAAWLGSARLIDSLRVQIIG